LPEEPRATPVWVPVQAPGAGVEGRENVSDSELVEEIYRRLWQDDSVDLMHVNIVALGGRVKLQGQVGSVEESRTIEYWATEVAGRGNVTNELQVLQR